VNPWAAAVRAVARRRPHLPGSAVAAGIAVASLVDADAPLVGLPACRRALVVAPHPDDETIGAGGTIARLAARGVHVEVLVVTDGEATIGARTSEAEVAASRRREVAAACAVLGTAPPVSLGVPDGAVHEHEPTVTAACEASIRELDPDLVLVPWSHERHPDHRATTAAVAACARLPEQLWQYEVHTPIPYPDRVVDITGRVRPRCVARSREVAVARDARRHRCRRSVPHDRPGRHEASGGRRPTPLVRGRRATAMTHGLAPEIAWLRA
jgi:LmbE family N-acetylglucosaminyl deacetylase